MHFARNAIIFYCLLEQYVTVIRVVISSLRNSHSVVAVPLPEYCCSIDLHIVAVLLASLLLPQGVRMHYFFMNKGGKSKYYKLKTKEPAVAFPAQMKVEMSHRIIGLV